MPQEIERKFLVHQEIWQSEEKPMGEFYAQGYLCSDKDRTVRVRLTPTSAFLTIKGRPAMGSISRSEFEYEIPRAEGFEILNSLCKNSIEKVRYKIPLGNHIWEVDVFQGANAPLVVAEIELEDEGQVFEKPDWIAIEVSHDHRYANSALSQKPFSSWEDNPAS